MRCRAHLQKPEMRDAADLDARAVVLQAILEFLFNRAVVAVFLHVDEVDNDQAREVAQAKLAGDFLGGLQVGLQRRVLDGVFACRLARVDVDGDKRLGLVDDDVAAGLQPSRWAESARRVAPRCPSSQRLGCDSRQGCTIFAWLGISMRMKSFASR
jgi:hypothetical protein